MKLLINNEIDLDKWHKLGTRSPYKSPFQTPSFYEIYKKTPTLDVYAFALEDAGVDDYLALMLITIQKEKGLKGFFSRRGIVYGGPLLKDNNEGTLELLLDKIEKYLKNIVIYIEIRNYLNYRIFDTIFLNRKWIYLDYVNITVKTDNKTLQDITNTMKYNRRREIKLTQERGVIFRECASKNELEELYLILKDLYKERVKLPMPSLAFFYELWKSKVGKVFVVLHDMKIIAGAFCLFDEFAVYTMYYCGMRNYDKKIFPTHIAVLASLNFAVSNKCNRLDFMGAGLKNEDYGVRSYKMEFGGELNEYGRYRRILNPFLFAVGNWGVKFMKKIK